MGILAPRFGKLAGRIGQRPLLLAGGLSFAAGGLWRVIAIGADAHYVRDYLPGQLLTGLGVALCLPALASVSAQNTPANRLGVGGAVNQSVRQFGGTIGVALTIAFIAQPTSASEALANFDRVWWLIVVGGVATTLLSLPLQTRRVSAAEADAEAEDVALAIVLE